MGDRTGALSARFKDYIDDADRDGNAEAATAYRACAEEATRFESALFDLAEEWADYKNGHAGDETYGECADQLLAELLTAGELAARHDAEMFGSDPEAEVTGTPESGAAALAEFELAAHLATQEAPMAGFWPKLRKVTAFEPCEHHVAMYATETRSRRAEVMVEGGFAQSPCPGARCRMKPGTDFYAADFVVANPVYYVGSN